MKLYQALGLMSGTSLDGVDVCRIETDGEGHVVQRGRFYKPYPEHVKLRLTTVSTSDIPLADLLRLEHELTTLYAAAVLESGLAHGVDVIGCHGQTIRHLPQEGLTWQLGDVSLLTQRIEEGLGKAVPVVMDFRRRDMAAGGEGAPLVPLFHAIMMENMPKPAAMLNIGGVANVSVLGQGGRMAASDCGPGMGLLDSFMKARTGEHFDKDGNRALAGTVHRDVVEMALAEIPFWRRPVPRSADRYEFVKVLEQLTGFSVEDGAATLAALTAAGVDVTLRDLNMTPQALKALVPVGGGARNRAVVEELQALGWAVRSSEGLGWDVATVEAACFAWLAVRRLRGLPTSLPQTTGARVATVGGVVAFAA